MSLTPPSERCEAYSREISAFVDGELPFPESLPAVDHIAACETCRSFYLAARRLSERMASAPAASAPDSTWERIAGSAPTPAAARSRGRFSRRTVRALGLAAAAVLAVALGVVRFRATPAPSAAIPGPVSSPLREIVVEGARGKMTDDRFLSLLSELLSADRKYHRETERVLRFVLRREDSGRLGEPYASPTEGAETGDRESGNDETGKRNVRAGRPLTS